VFFTLAGSGYIGSAPSGDTYFEYGTGFAIRRDGNYIGECGYKTMNSFIYEKATDTLTFG
jgi:hypothetical protein